MLERQRILKSLCQRWGVKADVAKRCETLLCAQFSTEKAAVIESVAAALGRHKAALRLLALLRYIAGHEWAVATVQCLLMAGASLPASAPLSARPAAHRINYSEEELCHCVGRLVFGRHEELPLLVRNGDGGLRFRHHKNVDSKAANLIGMLSKLLLLRDKIKWKAAVPQDEGLTHALSAFAQGRVLLSDSDFDTVCQLNAFGQHILLQRLLHATEQLAALSAVFKAVGSGAAFINFLLRARSSMQAALHPELITAVLTSLEHEYTRMFWDHLIEGDRAIVRHVPEGGYFGSVVLDEERAPSGFIDIDTAQQLSDVAQMLTMEGGDRPRWRVQLGSERGPAAFRSRLSNLHSRLEDQIRRSLWADAQLTEHLSLLRATFFNFNGRFLLILAQKLAEAPNTLNALAAKALLDDCLRQTGLAKHPLIERLQLRVFDAHGNEGILQRVFLEVDAHGGLRPLITEELRLTLSRFFGLALGLHAAQARLQSMWVASRQRRPKQLSYLLFLFSNTVRQLVAHLLYGVVDPLFARLIAELQSAACLQRMHAAVQLFGRSLIAACFLGAESGPSCDLLAAVRTLMHCIARLASQWPAMGPAQMQAEALRAEAHVQLLAEAADRLADAQEVKSHAQLAARLRFGGRLSALDGWSNA